MFQITLNELIRVIQGETKSDPVIGNKLIRGISIDSRSIRRGNIFVAIPGERFDGHQFLKEASEKGTSAAVVNRDKVDSTDPEILKNVMVILVQDTKKALGDLASWYRRKFDIPTVAVTGTNGKTTTKDMIGEVLSSKFKVLKSPKSYNNLIGVPLTLFQLNSNSEALVVELGMSSPGEIGILTRMSKPSIGVITNIGPAHLESMLSLERIVQAKFELPNNMSSPHTLILNADDPILAKRMRPKNQNQRVISFGIQREADFRADRIELKGEGYTSFRINKNLNINLMLLGIHNVYNALAAFAVGSLLKVEPQEIKQRLERYTPSELRMELVQIKDIRMINDSYNANPVSMVKALGTLKDMKTSGRKIAVLGDMLELGEKAMDFHLEVGRNAATSGVDLLLTVGELARFIGKGAEEAGMDSRNIRHFENNQKVSFHLLENLKGGDLVLVKGSRRMKTEEVILSLINLYGRQN